MHGVKHNNADTLSRFPQCKLQGYHGCSLGCREDYVGSTNYMVRPSIAGEVCMDARTITHVLHVAPDLEYGAVVML
jgi:hypothetical protein